MLTAADHVTPGFHPVKPRAQPRCVLPRSTAFTGVQICAIDRCPSFTVISLKALRLRGLVPSRKIPI